MGGTPLYDAIGQTIDKVGADLAALPEYDRPKRVMFIIQTDGQENSSREYTKEMIKERIEHQQSKYSWQFLFLSADASAIQDAQSFGVNKNMTVAYTSDSKGATEAFRSASLAASTFRSSN